MASDPCAWWQDAPGSYCHRCGGSGLVSPWHHPPHGGKHTHRKLGPLVRWRSGEYWWNSRVRLSSIKWRHSSLILKKHLDPFLHFCGEFTDLICVFWFWEQHAQKDQIIKTCQPCNLVIVSVLRDLITSGRCSHTWQWCLLWPLLIRSHFPALYANTH